MLTEDPKEGQAKIGMKGPFKKAVKESREKRGVRGTITGSREGWGLKAQPPMASF